MRVKFNLGQQKLFLNYVMQKNSWNLRELAERSETGYELIKKYHQEKCFISSDLFFKLSKLGKINSKNLDIELLDDNWGKIIGGKKGIVAMREKHLEKLKEWCARGGKR